jgi:hypothetical protein
MPVTRILLAVLVLLWAVPVSATTYYVRDGATGTACTDWGANACDTVQAAYTKAARATQDTICIAEGSYAAPEMDKPASGSNVITLKKATAADHCGGDNWLDSYGDGQAAFGTMIPKTNYHTIDGNGAIFTTYGFTFSGDTSAGVFRFTSNLTGITLKHAEIKCGNGTDANISAGIRAGSGSTNPWFYNVKVSNCQDDAHKFTAMSGGLIEYSWVNKRGSKSIPTCDCHGDAFDIAGSGSGATLRYSRIDWKGQHIFFEGNSNLQVWNVYGNVQWGGWGTDESSTLDDSGKVADSHITIAGASVTLNYYNNTVWEMPSHFTLESMVAGVARNNVLCGRTRSTGGFSSLTHSHNYFETGIPSNGESGAQTGACPLADPESLDFSLATETNAGMTIASTATDTFGTDGNGETRGADGTWDRGAFEFTGAPVAPNITTTSMDPGVTGVAYGPFQLQRSGGVAAFTWSNNTVSDTTLNDSDTACAGLTVSTSGLVSGTPTTVGDGTCSWTAKLVDGNAASDTQPLTIAITEPPPPVGDGDASDAFGCATTCSLGAEWTHQTTTAQISLASDQATSTTAQTRHLAFYAAEAFDPNQRSCVTITSTPTNTAWQYAGVRMSGTGASANGYLATAEGGATIVAKLINNGRTALATISSIPWASGNQLCLQIDGSTLKVYRNDSQIGDVAGIDSGGQLSAGAPGIGLWGGATLDSWEGFNLSLLPPPNQNPIAAWVTPTSGNTYSTSAETLNIAGTCTDNDGSIGSVSVTNNGVSVGAIGGPTTWSKAGIALVVGLNRLIATCTDDDAATGTAQLDVTRASPTETPVRTRLRVR